jgi:hypothetical protein
VKKSAINGAETMTQSIPMRPNDVAGQPAGPIDRAEHELEPWHKLVTALLFVLRSPPHNMMYIDEMRRAMEDIPPDEYQRLEYFEKWALGITQLVTEKGLVSRDRIESRVAELQARQRRGREQ